MSDWIEAEFETIFREHYLRIVRVVRRVVQGAAEAEEISAEVFLRLYRAGPAVASTGLVGGWLYRTASRAAIDALRARQRRGQAADLDAEAYRFAGDADTGPLNDLIARERIADVRSVLATMKPGKAQMLLLRQGGLSYREIAVAMQINAASVGTMLVRAETEFAALYSERQSHRDHGQVRSAHSLKMKIAKEEQ